VERENDGLTVWFTGAGKTSICNAVYSVFTSRGYRVEVLDGDGIRHQVSRDLGFSKQDRDENVRRIGVMAETLTKQGMIVLVAAIFHYRGARDGVRQRIGHFLRSLSMRPSRSAKSEIPGGISQGPAW
jgi:adenylylsulfate kinase